MSYKFLSFFITLCFIFSINETIDAQTAIKKRSGSIIQNKKLDTERFSKKIYIDLNQNSLSAAKVITSVTNQAKQANGTQKSGDLTINMQGGELVIKYPTTPLENDEYYKVSFNVQLNEQPIDIAPEMVKQAVGTIYWFGLAEKYTQLTGNLEVTVIRETWGDFILPLGVTCDIMPTFTAKQKLPHWIGFGVGAAAVGGGLVLEAKSDDIYINQYENYNTRIENERTYDEIYDEANKKHQAAQFLIFAGGGLILADAVLLIIRQNRYKKRLKIYNDFCGKEGLSLQPTIDFSASETVGAQVGLKMQFTF